MKDTRFAKTKIPNSMKSYEIVVILLALLLIVYEIALDASSISALSRSTLIWSLVWGIIAGSQMLVTKALRVPIAPGKWYDFAYVPLWVLIFTLPALLSYFF